jgi:hypothetical protein
MKSVIIIIAIVFSIVGAKQISAGNPEQCLAHASMENCTDQFEYCKTQYNPAYTNYCASDKKFCSEVNWEAYCIDGRSICQMNCIAICNKCLNKNGSKDFDKCHSSCD